MSLIQSEEMGIKGIGRLYKQLAMSSDDVIAIIVKNKDNMSKKKESDENLKRSKKTGKFLKRR